MRRPNDLKPSVRVNVYNASSDAVGIPGCCGAYHSGIEINGTEFAFGFQSGVYECRLGDYGPIVESVDLGQSVLTNAQISSALSELRLSFTGDTYHVILKNCNHFSEAFAQKCVGRGIPAWVNRAAWWASWFKCCFPANLGSPSETIAQPLLTATPLYAGEGMVVAAEAGPRLSPEEQRQARLRKLQQ